MARAAILGCEGPAVGAAERAFFGRTDPLGFILFARNVQSPDQVRQLCADLRASVGRPDAPILIDQEGGRVQRLRPPHWRAAPPAARFGALWQQDPEAAKEAAWLNARLIAHELAALGITVDCAPVADVPVAGAHDVIGDRAYGSDPLRVAELATVVARGLLDGGVLPVLKHLPGHGRARADSHAELPVVQAARSELDAIDFAAFRRAAPHAAWGMTAHVLFTALDAARPATTSPIVIAEVIRRQIGFDGVLVSDDLSMQALQGDLGERTRASLAAGCDVALHCNGKMAEMEAVMAAAPALAPPAARRVAEAERQRAAWAQRARQTRFDPGQALARLEELLALAAA